MSKLTTKFQDKGVTIMKNVQEKKPDSQWDNHQIHLSEEQGPWNEDI